MLAHERLRVLVVTESFLPQVNGVTGSVCRVLDHLAERGHEALVVAPTGPPTYAGFPVRRVGGAALPFYPDFRLGWERRRRLEHVVRRFAPDVVHLASPAALGLQVARVARAQGVPTVGIYQTDLVGFAARYGVPGGAAAMESFTRRVHAAVDRTLAPSRASLDQLTRLGVHDVHRWPRGVDQDLFTPDRRNQERRSGLAGDRDLLVGYVGRLAPEKELSLLHRVATDPRVRLVVVGDGPERLSTQRALPGAELLGVRHGPDLADVVADLDVLVHPGRHETFCQVVQEAMASGVPVVAVDSGGPRDLVQHGRTGLLVPAGDATAIHDAVRALALDPGRRRAMGAAARAAVASRTWEAVNDALLEHYHAVRGGVRVQVPAAG